MVTENPCLFVQAYKIYFENGERVDSKKISIFVHSLNANFLGKRKRKKTRKRGRFLFELTRQKSSISEFSRALSMQLIYHVTRFVSLTSAMYICTLQNYLRIFSRVGKNFNDCGTVMRGLLKSFHSRYFIFDTIFINGPVHTGPFFQIVLEFINFLGCTFP